MYYTPSGYRTLQGAEARLFREILGITSDRILEEWGDDSFEIPAFDALSRGSKFAMLEYAGSALLLESVPPPPLTAVLEGTVGATFATLRTYIELDITSGQPVTTFIQDLFDVIDKEDFDFDTFPTVENVTMEDCDLLIECVSGQILWDEDWRDDDLYQDLPPQLAGNVKKFMCIDNDYFTGIAPDPDDSEIPEIIKRIRNLSQQPED